MASDDAGLFKVTVRTFRIFVLDCAFLTFPQFIDWSGDVRLRQSMRRFFATYFLGKTPNAFLAKIMASIARRRRRSSSSITKWAAHISQERFDIEPQFDTSEPSYSTATLYDFTSYFQS